MIGLQASEADSFLVLSACVSLCVYPHIITTNYWSEINVLLLYVIILPEWLDFFNFWPSLLTLRDISVFLKKINHI